MRKHKKAARRKKHVLHYEVDSLTAVILLASVIFVALFLINPFQ